MVTFSNYNQEIKNVDFSKLPQEVKAQKSDVESIMKFYNDDKDIKEAVDDFISIINKAHQNKTHQNKAKPKATKKSTQKK